MFVMTTLVAIRAKEYSEEVENAVIMAKSIWPDNQVVVISDAIEKEEPFPKHLDVIYITKTVLDELQLFYLRDKIGWAAGDYAYLVALRRDWDFMWLIEPDVFVSEDMYGLLRNLADKPVDLIATNINKRNENWVWTQRLRATTQFHTITGAFFPLTRLSRRLAEEILPIRQEISGKLVLDETLKVPNDESVVGTVSSWKRLTTLDLKKEFPTEFLHFSFNVRSLREDLLTKSGVYHPVYLYPTFEKRVLSELRRALSNTSVYQTLLQSSEDTRKKIFKSLFNE